MDNILIENLIKVALAVVVGGVIGAEREFRDKAAGFRTIILITVGSTLFTIFSMTMDEGFTRTRIAANIVTGIGFLGAGAIVREHGRIGGLTTAATIWLSAALGMGIGAGQLPFVLVTTLAVLVVLLVFPHLEIWIDGIRETRTYRISFPASNVIKLEKIRAALRSCGLLIHEHHQSKSDDAITDTWTTRGKPDQHEQFVAEILKDSEIKEFTY